MRILVTVLVALSISFLAACAPKADGPPTTEEQQVTAPAASPADTAAAAPADGETPAMPPGHPPMSGGVSPPAGHMGDGGAKSITETEGAIVNVTDDEFVLSRPSGTELKFMIPQDLKVLPHGKTRGDLKEGAKVKITIRQVDTGMEADTIEFLPEEPAHK